MRAAPQPGPVRQNKRRNAVGSGLRAAGPGKRRRRANSESNPVLPSNFLLGGNIFDPLNLNSLLDEEVSRALNAETPECSPLPAKSREPVEILVPRDVTDPLSLNRAGHALLPAPRRRRPRHRHHGPQPRPAPPPRVPGRPSSPPSLPGVAPRAPREGAASPVPRPLPQNQPGSSSSCDPAPFPPALAAPGPASAPPPQKKFQYGNYNKYYGYRNPGCSEDPRLRVMRPEWFRGKAVLDLGCNAGHLTLFIARHWRPGRIVGLDIDGCLVHAARQNVRHYLSHLQALEARRAGRGPGPGEEETPREGGENERGGARRRVGARLGPIAAPPLPDTPSAPPGDFPANVSFVRGNYVLGSDALLQSQRGEFDVILCLSVSKWVHLNWGDAGLQRLFHRAYRHLHPGGVFILEPQPWSSYARRRKLNDTIYKNYHSIRLKPDQFCSYLTSEVGFTSYELLGTPKSTSRGFERPVYKFYKGRSSPKK
ncbi:hypothetical protein COCON_G00072180 [Conger conger]|uniref:RNA methyltransferase n=1 Tax=Conger conger TaxID=82655 RepID=A0A9Q1I142_CONCO|nr:hypothetical protein COCON_G00072180 [Conger conger]